MNLNLNWCSRFGFVFGFNHQHLQRYRGRNINRDYFWENFPEKLEKFGKIGKIWENWENLGKLGKFGKIGKIWENWENLGKLGKFGKIGKIAKVTFEKCISTECTKVA